jgi:hypothetical protein
MKITKRALACVGIATLVTLSSSRSLAQPKNPERDVFFGQTHVHTSWSFDAYIFGNTVTGPEEAYKYALGQPIKHPAGQMVKIKRPLDFQAVTDHSEYAGTIKLANDPNSAISKLPIAEKLKVKTKDDIQKIYLWLGTTIVKNEPVKELVSAEVAGTVWKQVVSIADKYYKPGKFTTFVAYEWTSTPANRNMHRNVIFKDSKKVPALPFSSIDSTHPEDLWTWMDGQRKTGNELLAISHNANLSDGIMFPLEVDNKGRPIDAAWAQQRVNNEPLSEIQQLKGASETHPLLSPNDEFASHEILNYLLGGIDRTPKVHGSYIREAYQNGLAMLAARGYNPYKFGLVGASDSHNTAVSYTESNFFGGHGFMDGTSKQRLSGKKEANLDMALLSTSGLGGVWAEENTREAIFAAMQRKETFGTSGVRIKVRLFGGWEFGADALKQKEWVKTAYSRGVPMGGDLPAAKGKAPTFIVWAVKDPDEANLDRIQIIKGWTKNGQIFEKIYDVAGNRNRNIGNERLAALTKKGNVQTGGASNGGGAVELKTVWTDPEFDASLHAFYYARVLQVPTPRWTTIQAKELGIAPPSNVPATVQERAWSSPIWYTPGAEATKSAQRGVTVADLKQKGATALDDAALKQLVVGKTFTVRNTVTGQRFEILYGPDGRRLITSIDGKQPEAGQVGDVLHSGELGSPAQYEIRGGRIITTIGMTPFDVAVYKVGDRYVASRSNEFGYANYEIEAMKQ